MNKWELLLAITIVVSGLLAAISPAFNAEVVIEPYVNRVDIDFYSQWSIHPWYEIQSSVLNFPSSGKLFNAGIKMNIDEFFFGLEGIVNSRFKREKGWDKDYYQGRILFQAIMDVSTKIKYEKFYIGYQFPSVSPYLTFKMFKVDNLLRNGLYVIMPSNYGPKAVIKPFRHLDSSYNFDFDILALGIKLNNELGYGFHIDSYAEYSNIVTGKGLGWWNLRVLSFQHTYRSGTYFEARVGLKYRYKFISVNGGYFYSVIKAGGDNTKWIENGNVFDPEFPAKLKHVQDGYSVGLKFYIKAKKRD
jgi:hypothetical protein